MGIGDWGLALAPTTQPPIPNPQSPIPIFKLIKKIKSFFNFIN